MNTFSIKEALGFGWRTTKQYFLFLVGLLVIVFAISFLFSWLFRVTADMNSALGFVAWIADMVVSILIGMGIIYILLEFCDHKVPAYKDLIQPYPLFFKYLVASIFYGLVVCVGFILFIIPGIFLAVKYSMYRYLVIDKGLGPVEALTKSGEITYGAKWKLLGYGIIVGLINIGGALLFGVGLFVTIPITMIATAYVYRTLLRGGGMAAREQVVPTASQAPLPEAPNG